MSVVELPILGSEYDLANHSPALLILDDDGGVAATLASMLEVERLEIHRTSTCADALAILRQHPQINVVLADVCLQGEDGLAFAGSLHQQLGGRAWLQVIMITGQPRLDFAISAVRNHVDDFLLKPIRRRDLNGAVERAIQRSLRILRQTYVHEGVKQSLERIRQHFDEVSSEFSQASRAGSPAGSGDGEPVDPADEGAVTPDRLESLLAWMRLRDHYFGHGVFCDAAWNIMLELFRSKTAGKRVSMKSACLAAGVPATTALRRLTELEAGGLVHKQADRRDKRRLLVELTPMAYERMAQCLNDLFDIVDSQGGAGKLTKTPAKSPRPRKR